jgi:hypothetical protein
MRHAWVPLLALALLPAVGCLQIEEAITLYPDGSGTLTMDVALSKVVLAAFEARAKKLNVPPVDFFAQFRDPAKLAENSEGFVAWVPGRPTADGAWIRLSVKGYFEDINQARFYTLEQGPGGASRNLAFMARIARTPAGSRLLMTANRSELRRIGSHDEADRAEVEMLKPFLKDCRFTLRVTAPGPVQDQVGFFRQEGRRVWISLDGTYISNAITNPAGPEADQLRRLGKNDDIRVSWSNIDLPDADVRTFKAEMAAAKAGWAQMRAGKAALPAESGKAAPPGPDPATLTDDEVNRLFIQAQIKAAREHLRAGNQAKARSILESVLKEFPKEKASLEARKLLEETN